MIRNILIFQACYFCTTGLWALFHLSSFMAVTGPKVETWLVKMVGLLAFAYGIGLFINLLNRVFEKGFYISLLLACLSFAWIDFYYALTGVISPVYLLDGFIQIVFIATIIISLKKARSGKI